jgi:two-component system copper resistance phosphate regulon response regulator CusR
VAGILIVEDEARIASFLSRALSSCGFEVAWASSSPTAIRMLEGGHYDLVLLDLLLSGKNGFTVLERAFELRPSQEVLVLSALSDVESKIKCFQLGAADYVTKPFNLAELVARIRARIRHSRDLNGTRYLESGSVRLDLQRRDAFVGEQRIALSTREFHLLLHLMQREGEVCPREELLASVWGYTFDPRTNVVDVYVRRLRGKLGGEVIETIRNVGYCYPSAA